MSALNEFLAEISAMGREAIKDVRATVHEAVFDRPEHAPDPGAPLNMLHREIYEQKHDVELPKETDFDMDH